VLLLLLLLLQRVGLFEKALGSWRSRKCILGGKQNCQAENTHTQKLIVSSTDGLMIPFLVVSGFEEHVTGGE
jgi:hypothetical protein